jgi:hypothetical protein
MHRHGDSSVVAGTSSTKQEMVFGSESRWLENLRILKNTSHLNPRVVLVFPQPKAPVSPENQPFAPLIVRIETGRMPTDQNVIFLHFNR